MQRPHREKNTGGLRPESAMTGLYPVIPADPRGLYPEIYPQDVVEYLHCVACRQHSRYRWSPQRGATPGIGRPTGYNPVGAHVRKTSTHFDDVDERDSFRPESQPPRECSERVAPSQLPGSPG